VNTIKINIYADPSRPEPSLSLPDVPGHAGITALQATIIGEALDPSPSIFVFSIAQCLALLWTVLIRQVMATRQTTIGCSKIDGEEVRLSASESILLDGQTKTQGRARVMVCRHFRLASMAKLN
jgi:hypothetical protein